MTWLFFYLIFHRFMVIDKTNVYIAFSCSGGLNVIPLIADEAQDVINFFPSPSFIQNSSLVCVSPQYQRLILGFLESQNLLNDQVAWRQSCLDNKYIDLLVTDLCSDYSTYPPTFLEQLCVIFTSYKVFFNVLYYAFENL